MNKRNSLENTGVNTKGVAALLKGTESKLSTKVNMVFLLLFLTAMHRLVKRRGGQGADWSRLAMVAGTMLSAYSPSQVSRISR